MTKTQCLDLSKRRIEEVRFLKSVAEKDQLPPVDLPEIAFFGASNVGKSSLINVLFHRKNLAKSSKTPGRTQLLNFFICPPDRMIVDAPGYGFAHVPDHIRKTWETLILSYLESRSRHLKAYLLIDARRCFKANDFQMMDLFQQYQIDYQIIMTKMDKLNQTQQTQLEQTLQEQFSLAQPIIMTSTKTKAGLDQISL